MKRVFRKTNNFLESKIMTHEAGNVNLCIAVLLSLFSFMSSLLCTLQCNMFFNTDNMHKNLWEEVPLTFEKKT